MSKLGCKCGHVIQDNTDYLPYRGSVLRHQDTDCFYDTASRELALFASAVAVGKRAEWINRHFLPGYPHDISDDSVISDFLNMLDVELATLIYECENCGRLWVQIAPGAKSYVPFSPDDGEVHRVLVSARYAHAKAEAPEI